MSFPVDTIRKWIAGGKKTRLWSRAHRLGALQEIEERFHLRLTEEEVFRASSLFFSLLLDYSLIDKEDIARKVRQELRIDLEKKAPEKHEGATC